jgi:hypothetical protein
MNCPKCGREVEEGAKFCKQCGSPIASFTAPPTPPTPPHSPGTTPTISPSPPGFPQPKVKKMPLKPLILGLTGLLVVAAVVLILVLVVFKGKETTGTTAKGKAMSLQEYKSKVSEIHSGVGADLTEALSSLEGASIESIENINDAESALKEAENSLGDAQDVVEEGLSELEKIDPPREVESLHEELLDFYADSSQALKETRTVVSYLLKALKTMDVVSNLENMEAEMNTATTTDQIITVLQKYKDIILRMVADLEKISPPPDLKQFHQGLVKLWKNITTAFDEMIVAIQTNDMAKIQQAQNFINNWERDTDTLLGDFTESMNDVAYKLQDLGDRGSELEDKIEAL